MTEKLTFHKCDPSEIDLLVQCRIDFCVFDHPDNTRRELDQLRQASREWMERHLQAGDYWGHVGRLGGELACAAGILLYELPPIGGNLSRMQGHVLNFFTYPAHRRQGIGNALMQYLIADSRAAGLDKLVLNATAMGESVYLRNGFSEPSLKNLVFKLK